MSGKPSSAPAPGPSPSSLSKAGQSDRPPSSRRPRTGGAKRPATARPDTGASGIGDLPDQQFFPEGEDFDEDEEEYDDEEEEEGGDVFAFARPQTGAVPSRAFSDYTLSAPNTGKPTTAGTFMTDTSGVTGVTGATFGIGGAEGSRRPSAATIASLEPTGFVDHGGNLPQLEYDTLNPPPFSGRQNPNNSAFAFRRPVTGQSKASSSANGPSQPATSRSLFSKISRRHINTATTAMTGSTDYTATSFGRSSFDSATTSEAGSYTETDATGSVSRPHGAKRMRSSAPLIPNSEAGDTVSNAGTKRGLSRGSYGMTEMTGDMTVPDGKTTWGDGLGGMLKEGDDEGSLAPIDLDMAEEDSPYPEVRASVSNIDDPEMLALTFRSWTLGMFFAILGSVLNCFFQFRTPAPFITPLIIQIVTYPVGKFCSLILPIRTFKLPRWLGSFEWSFNPGPFNIKEHTVIIMMTNVSITPAFALNAIVSAELWYGKTFGAGFNVLLVLVTQLTGFAFAGLCRRFVVWPGSMIWPGNLVVTTNLYTLHAEDDGHGSGMSRFKFLVIAGSGACAYYFFPGFIFTALSYFSWICWIAPNNVVVNNLFGVTTGLGMGVLTFDWTQVTWFGSPLVTPWWAAVNIGGGFVLFYWIIVPIFYYNNVWQTAHLPISVDLAADRFNNEYNVFAVLTADGTFNNTAYAEYSPVYLPAAFAMTFMLAFALSTAVIVHTALHHGPRIARAVRRVQSETDDIHMKLMRAYPEVPDWWFACLFVVVFILACVTVEVYHTGLPIWGYVLSVVIPFIYTLPAAFILAMTTQIVALNLLAELIPGYLFPSEPIPNMLFKVFAVQSLTESLNFVQDQKLGHYMKIPPRVTFTAQLSAAFVTCFAQTGTKLLLFYAVPTMCEADQKNLLTCNGTKTFFSSSIIWGLIGPQRLFSPGALYHNQVYAALIGAIIPVPLYLWVRHYPRSILRNVNLPVVLNGSLYIPPASGINYASWLGFSFVFQFVIRRRYFAWWSKYNYTLSAALDVGTAISGVAIFLVLDLTGATLNWWGNEVYLNTIDYQGSAVFLATPTTGFGPDTWKT